MTADPCFLSIARMGVELRAGTFSARELTGAFLDRIKREDQALCSYALLLEESALAEADRADRELRAGADRGPLHGIAVAIKDLIDAEGAPTLAGMPLRAGHRARRDATVLSRLRAAGAVVLGKLALTEGASMAHHPASPAPRNPWAPDHDPGFSSSGSGVAVAAGLCAAALGSDTAGSIRIPSAWNGVTGLKPTWGRVSRDGIFALTPYLDTIGPMARSAETAAAMLAAIAGADPRDPTACRVAVPDYCGTIGKGVRGLRIGVDWPRAHAECDAAILEGLRHAGDVLAAQGAAFRDIALPSPDIARLMPLLLAGVGDGHRATFPAREGEYGPAMRALLRAAAAVPAIDVAAAINHAGRFRAELDALFGEVDLILAPAMPSAAPPVGRLIEEVRADPDTLLQAMGYTMPFNVSGNPTITFPTGFAGGLPLAAQIIARPFAEERLLQAAHAFQIATEWHSQRPPDIID